MEYNKTVYFSCYIFNDYYSKQLNAQKAIVLSSFAPFYNQFQSLLYTFHSVIINKKLSIPIEAAIYNLIFDIPMPPPGIYTVQYNFYDWFNVDFRQECINKIPFPPVDFKIFFQHFSIQALMQLVKLVLIEVPIFIFCEDKYNLCTLVQGLQSLILPFKTENPVISILPKVYYSMVEYLDKFIIGINKKYTANFFETESINIKNKNLIIVEIDYSSKEISKFHQINKDNTIKIINIKDLPRNINHEKNEKKINFLKDISLPYYYTNKLYNTMNNYLYEKNGKKKTNDQINNVELRFMFYYYFVAVLLHYRSYCMMDEKYLIDLYPKILNNTYQIRELFKVDEYLLTIDPRDQTFFTYFFESDIWKHFIIKSLYPFTISETMEGLLFDEMITMKKNKKIKKIIKNATPILNNVSFEHKKLILINCEKNDKKRSSTVYERNRNSLAQKKIFPNLNYDVFSTINPNKDVPTFKYFEEFECQCLHFLLDDKFKDFYNGIETIYLHKQLHYSFKSYVYKLWLKLFSLSFWYVDKKERWKRFNELLYVISKIPSDSKKEIFDKEIIYNLILCIICYGDKEMIVQLYSTFGYKDYNVFINIHSKLSQGQNEEFPKYDFLKKRNLNILSQNKNEDVNYQLYLTDLCKICKTKIGFTKELIQSDVHSNEILTFYCEKCKKYQQAKVYMMNIGEDIKKEIILFSPYYLYNQLKTIKQLDIKNYYKDSKYLLPIIIYFQLNKLNFDFLFPYQSEERLHSYPVDSLQKKKVMSFQFPAKYQPKKYFESFYLSENYNMSNTISYYSSKSKKEKRKWNYKDSYSAEIINRNVKRAYSFEQQV